jgi:hypothetical protein
MNWNKLFQGVFALAVFTMFVLKVTGAAQLSWWSVFSPWLACIAVVLFIKWVVIPLVEAFDR